MGKKGILKCFCVPSQLILFKKNFLVVSVHILSYSSSFLELPLEGDGSGSESF